MLRFLGHSLAHTSSFSNFLLHFNQLNQLRREEVWSQDIQTGDGQPDKLVQPVFLTQGHTTPCQAYKKRTWQAMLLLTAKTTGPTIIIYGSRVS